VSLKDEAATGLELTQPDRAEVNTQCMEGEPMKKLAHSMVFAILMALVAGLAPWTDGVHVAAQSWAGGALVGQWRFTKYGPINGTFEFFPNGAYSYSVQHGTRRLAHQGTYQWRAPRGSVSLRGLLGIVELTPTKVLVEGAPTDLIVDSTLMDNDGPHEYFVQDNLPPQHTQGIRTLSLCDTQRDWPGCAQSTRLYAATRP